MSKSSRELIGLLLGAGASSEHVFHTLRKEINVLPIAMMPSPHSFRREQHLLRHPRSIGKKLAENKVTRYAFAGHLRLHETLGDPFPHDDVVPDFVDDELSELLDAEQFYSSDVLARLCRILDEYEAKSVHINELVDDFRIKPGWIVPPSRGLPEEYYVNTIIPPIIDTVNLLEKDESKHDSFLFEDERLKSSSREGTLDWLDGLRVEGQYSKRVFVKSCPADSNRTINVTAPVVEQTTFEACNEAGVELVILDATNGLAITQDECWQTCREHKIAVYGWNRELV